MRSALGLAALLCLWTGPLALRASPLPPNVRASGSANGEFLVIVEPELGPPDAQGVRRILRNRYEVSEAEDFNENERLQVKVPFWSESSAYWSVTPEGIDQASTFWPMISNDGKSLVLIGVGPGIEGAAVLQIYRKRLSGGTLVRSFGVSDLWTSREINLDGRKSVMITDATPLWFADSSLAFSWDDRQLVYTNRWKETLCIGLADGVVSRKCEAPPPWVKKRKRGR